MTTAMDQRLVARHTIGPWRVARELAVVEAIRLMRHPAILIGAGISLAIMVGVHWGEAAVWQRVSAGVSIPLAVFGLGAVLAVSDMSYRMWRTQDSEGIDVLPASPRVRAFGQALAASSLVVMAATLQAGYMLFSATQRPVGNVALWEVAAGPTTVFVMVAVALAAGRWIPSPITGPIAVLGLVAVNAVLALVGNLAWLALVPGWEALSNMEGPPPELAFRPMAFHVVYLIALGGCFIAVIFLRGRWERGSWSLTLAALGFASVAAIAGSLNVQVAEGPDLNSRLSLYLGGEADYTCQTRRSVTYCAYPGYEGWIEEWAGAIEPVLDQLPMYARSPIEVRQYPIRWMDTLQIGNEYRYGVDVPYLGEDIRTGLWWGFGAGDLETESYRFGMSLGAAAWAVGLPTTPPEATLGDSSHAECHVAEQARGIVAVWLAGQASPTAHAHIHNVLDEYQVRFPDRFNVANGGIGEHQSYPWYRSSFTLAHFRYADQLLHRPSDEVSRLIMDHWDQLVDPSTTLDDAENLLKLDSIAWVPTDWQPDPSRLCQ